MAAGDYPTRGTPHALAVVSVAVGLERARGGVVAMWFTMPRILTYSDHASAISTSDAQASVLVAPGPASRHACSSRTNSWSSN